MLSTLSKTSSNDMMGHLPNTERYLGTRSDPLKVWGWVGVVGGPCEVSKLESLVIKELEVEPEYIVGVRG